MKCPTALKILKELNSCERTCTIFNAFENPQKKAEVKKALKELKQAINSHKKLVDALENLREELDEDHIHDREDCTGDCPICVIDDALKEAEKE
jgi:hypothetical protein